VVSARFQNSATIDLIVGKQRNGPVEGADVELLWRVQPE
jgi:replicative DNA helicase